jgi:uncharacterized protein (TIGR02145 family)
MTVKITSNNYEDMMRYKTSVIDLLLLTLLLIIPITSCSNDKLEDYDGNVYEIVQIGNQTWMAENLKVTHYRDGTPIPNVTEWQRWQKLSTGAYAVYENNEKHVQTYGYLYNWYAATDIRNIAPRGWHVPTDDEWKELEMNLGLPKNEANIRRYRGTNEGSKLASNAILWEKGRKSGDLEFDSEFGTSGFNALPGGSRRDWDGFFLDMGSQAEFWTATEIPNNGAYNRLILYNYTGITRGIETLRTGFPIRLVKD